ncbi:M17 family metallopeptidase [Mycoplasma leonicaptivi]|uniref:M17 family metallopeptidase n=1 Tax=Mycoplasma leonicaptivi TaxID=36742 RepID=UPI00055CCFBA|nr:peptidase M17 [Mycoplasma leonicaptivi]
MKLVKNNLDNYQLLKISCDNSVEWIAKKDSKVTDNISQKISYVYFDKKELTLEKLAIWVKSFSSSLNRNYLVDVKSFQEHFAINDLLRVFISSYEFAIAKLFKKTNVKNESNKTENQMCLYIENPGKEIEKLVFKLNVIAESVQKTRDLQITPENFLNSEMLAAKIAEDFSGIENLHVKTLTKKEIQELNMGLLLSVNKGSTHEPRVVIISYNGNKKSKNKTAIVGKGITFDTGGVNTKGYHMDGMKFDMSGSVIAAYTVKILALLKEKVNAYAIMCITDNRINADASLPENVYQSMSGKWVEVVDTDAEGRLVLADGIYYAADIIKPNTIIDVATLTGAILTSLGHVYSGIWSTNDQKWEVFANSAKIAQEKVWRMPLHEDFNKGNKSSKVADLASWSKTVRQDSSQAAMFLKEFTKDIDFIHCDVAGTADIAGQPQGVLVATLVEFIVNLENN